MEITLICTVYNEGDSLEELLDSIADQDRVPDEAVFVDGGSDDGTREVLEEYSERHEWLRFEVHDGVNIAEGRNIAIESASNEFIVGTDGGCVLDEGWCAAMEEAFEDGHEALSGLFQARSENLFEYVQGELRSGHYTPENVKDGWAPSSRSVGFTKKAWRDAGKYPEHLYTGEDARFNTSMREAGYDWHVVRDAMVYWEMRPDWSSYWDQFYTYGQGDARAGNLHDYPGKILGRSKVWWRLFSTWTGVLGVLAAPLSLTCLAVGAGGFGAQLAFKSHALLDSVREKGPAAATYWLGLVLTAAFGHFTGYYGEKLRKLGDTR